MQTTATGARASDEPRWLIPATFLGTLAILVVLFWALPAATGPLVVIPGDVDGSPVRAGVPFTYAGIPLQNVGSGPIALISATMGPHTSGLHLLGVKVAPYWTGYNIDPRGYPRRVIPGTHFAKPPPPLHSVAGTVLPGGPFYNAKTNFAWLIVGLRVDNPGDYTLRGMNITYRAGRFTYTVRTGPILSVCVPQKGEKTCRAPVNIAW